MPPQRFHADPGGPSEASSRWRQLRTRRVPRIARSPRDRRVFKRKRPNGRRPCNSSLRNQSAAYAAVPADGSNDLRLYSQTARNYRVCTRVRVELRRDVRSVCCVLVARRGEGAGPVGDSYAIRTPRLLGWHRAAAPRRADPHRHEPDPCRPAAAYCPRGSPDAQRQRADGLAPGRRRHSSRRAHPRVGADQ
jgi:hypothetical protein